MKLAQGSDRPAVAWERTAPDWTDADGNIYREIRCTQKACATGPACGSASWAFGVADEHTHLLVLRARMADHCISAECPHDDAYNTIHSLH
jgi:hypothetical protein